MATVQKVFTGVAAAFTAFREVLVSPDNVAKMTNLQRIGFYSHMWQLYHNTIFEKLELWADYIAKQRLYSNIRSIYNPVERLVDFYAGMVWPGVLSSTGEELPEGERLAIPLVTDDKRLREVIGQLWQWSNWQNGKTLLPRYGAMTGNVLAEVIDDREREKVYKTITWPGLVADIETDPTGNVTSYILEYDVADGNGGTFRFRKEVTKESFKFFRDDQPYKMPGATASAYDNEYGFVPAVWIKHKDTGTLWGSHACSSSLQKLDDVNSIASHAGDFLHKLIETPQIIFTDGEITDALAPVDDSEERAAINPDDIHLLKGEPGGSVEDLVGNLKPSDALDYIKHRLGEIESDHPELSMWQEMRSKSQITGPAAAQLHGDVDVKVKEAAGNYDRGDISLTQMCVAIGGYRFSRGQWRARTKAQAFFAPFNLQSYEKGDLNFTYAPRPIVAMTPQQIIELRKSRADLADQIAEHVSHREVLRVLGYTTKEAQDAIINERSTEDQTEGANFR